MDQPVSDIDLCEALSDLFVDNEVDFGYIVRVARAFPITHVEKVLFEWVAPVCYTNTLAPVPPIWTGFERDSLWVEVQRLLAREAKAGFAKKLFIMLRQFYLRQRFAEEWRRLSVLLAEKDVSDNCRAIIQVTFYQLETRGYSCLKTKEPAR